MERTLKVLISAYACGPNWGSEIGMGWNWVIHLSEHCELIVITELDFKKDIEEKLPLLNLKHVPQFHYIDVGVKARKLFWRQGSFLFYGYYKIWQKKAFKLAEQLLTEHDIDLIHQLNMIGYREPGFLWKIKTKPYLWGPVGGHNQVPLSFVFKMPLKNATFYLIKSAINSVQFYILKRPRLAANASKIVLAATRESAKALAKTTHNEIIVLNETGCEPPENTVILKEKDRNTLKLIWIGRLQGLKALPIALNVVKNLSAQIPIHLTIIGDGPDEVMNKTLASKLKIEKNITWLGRIPNTEVIEQLQKSDLLLFTSLKEGTPHVVMEALQNGIPVICHDSCGHGAVVTDSCGVKIEQRNEKHSISKFTEVLSKLYRNSEQIKNLSIGALEKSKELSWASKAKTMVEYYNEIIRNDNIT